MKKTLIACLACAGLMTAGVATSAADQGGKPDVAAKQCNEQKKADPAAFEATYGPKHAMQNCKRAAAPVADEAKQSASAACKAEQEADPALFDETYGTNGNKKNAFGKCVSAKTDEAVAAEVTEFQNAAKECRAERDADPAAFAAAYGTNANKKNAFGKCVSGKVKEDDEVAA